MNRAFIPLYINSAILNNLFAVIIQEFVEIKSISTKDSILVHLKTPMSELSYDLFGKYMQGDLDIQVQSEFVKQRTEENISTLIVILKKLKDILLAQGLLKQFSGSTALKDITVDDYVEFPGRLKRNPVMENLHNCIHMLEMSRAISSRPDEITTDALFQSNNMNLQFDKDVMIEYLKKSLDNHKQERCLRYIVQCAADENVSAVIPMKLSSMLDNEDYLMNGSVTILGKVVNTFNNENAFDDTGNSRGEGSFYNPLSNDAFFDYIDFTKLNHINNPLLNSVPKIKNTIETKGPFPQYEILPIAIYI